MDTTSSSQPQPKDPRLNPTLADKVAKARARWEGRRSGGGGRSKITASFDDLLDLIVPDCLTWSDIGSELGVSRERARQIFRDYFSALFPKYRFPGRKRRRVCSIQRRVERIKALEPVGNAAEAARRAWLAGIADVRAVTYPKSVRASSLRLIVNGKAVTVRSSKSPSIMHPRSLVGYYRFPTTAGQTLPCEFVILLAGTQTFVMPRDVFMSWNGNLSGNAVRDRYIPEHPNTYWMNAHLGQTDWLWQYREAWHLLK